MSNVPVYWKKLGLVVRNYTLHHCHHCWLIDGLTIDGIKSDLTLTWTKAYIEIKACRKFQPIPDTDSVSGILFRYTYYTGNIESYRALQQITLIQRARKAFLKSKNKLQ